MQLRDFDILWKFYPMWDVLDTKIKVFMESKKTPFQTQSWVVQNVNNTCVIKLCYALNCSVNPIRLEKIGSKYLTGVNGYYLIKVSDMIKYMKKRYGNPTVEVQEKGKKAKELLKGKKGIICFVIPFSDASGHFDLWNGSRVKKSDFFDHSRLQKIMLWEVSD